MDEPSPVLSIIEPLLVVDTARNPLVDGASSKYSQATPVVLPELSPGEEPDSALEPPGRQSFRHRFFKKPPTAQEAEQGVQAASEEPAKTASEEAENEEARDNFQEETLAPPSRLPTFSPGTPPRVDREE